MDEKKKDKQKNISRVVKLDPRSRIFRIAAGSLGVPGELWRVFSQTSAVQFVDYQKDGVFLIVVNMAT